MKTTKLSLHYVCRLQEKWTRIVLWPWPALMPQRSTIFIHVKDVLSPERTLTSWCGTQMQQGMPPHFYSLLHHSVQLLLSFCAGPSLRALRCKAETSTCTKGCAATAFLWSPSAEGVWCVRMASLCALKGPGSSTHSAFSPTSSIRRWSSGKR